MVADLLRLAARAAKGRVGWPTDEIGLKPSLFRCLALSSWRPVAGLNGHIVEEYYPLPTDIVWIQFSEGWPTLGRAVGRDA